MKRETDYGYPIKSMYTPKDIEGLQYERDLGDPGSYPYTRGYYSNAWAGESHTLRVVYIANLRRTRRRT